MNRPPDWMAVTDTHGDLIDPDGRDAVLRFVDVHEPGVRIHMGDVWDLRALRKNASDEERAEGIRDDIEAGLKFLRAYRPTHLLLGNHDYRLWEKADRCADGTLRDHCRMLIEKIHEELEDIGTVLFPYDVEDGIFYYGDRKFIHGYCHNMHSAHKAGQCYGNVTMGHVHQFQRACPERDDNPEAWTCGHLLDAKRAKYARRRQGTLRWQQGFMYGWKDDNEHVSTYTVEPTGGRWFISEGFQ